MEFNKEWLSYEDQTTLLIEKRGLIADQDELFHRLQEVGYYRLSGYWYIYKRCNSSECNDPKDERFVEGTTFEKIWDLYIFDRQFRLIVLDAIERVEIYFRAQLAYELARETDAFGYLDASSFPRFKKGDYDEFLRHCKTQYTRSREPFALHFKSTYGDDKEMPPYWIMVNLMDFGTMLRLYTGSSVAIRKNLSERLGVSARVLESWLIALNTTRNICAHHGRLWNRSLGTRPLIPKIGRYPEWHEPFEIRSDNMSGILTILSYLLQQIAPNTSWRNRLFDLLDRQTDEELNRMGFCDNWKESPLWKPWIEQYECKYCIF